jgi:hypothetical protein
MNGCFVDAEREESDLVAFVIKRNRICASADPSASVAATSRRCWRTQQKAVVRNAEVLAQTGNACASRGPGWARLHHAAPEQRRREPVEVHAGQDAAQRAHRAGARQQRMSARVKTFIAFVSERFSPRPPWRM